MALHELVSKEFPHQNLLKNNAGLMHSMNLQDHWLSVSELTNEMDANLKGVIWLNGSFLHLLKEN